MGLEKELELLRDSWTETFDQLFVLYEVAREVSSVSEHDEVLEHIADHIFLLFEAELAAVFLIDKETMQLVLKSVKGVETKKTGAIFKVGEGVAGKVASTGQSLVIAQGVSERQFKIDSEVLGIKAPRTLLCVPIILRGGEVIGVIEIVNKKRGVFTLKDRDFLSALASIAALSVENALAYKQIQNNEIYQAQVIENLPEGFLAINNDGRITHMNSLAKKMLGISDEDKWQSKLCSAVLKDEQELCANIKAALHEGKLMTLKEMVLSRTGKPVYMSTFIFRGADNLIIGAGAAFQEMVLKRG